MTGENESTLVGKALEKIDRRLAKIERLLEIATGRLDAVEAAVQSGGINLADFTEPPRGWEGVLALIRDFQTTEFLRDFEYHLSHLAGNHSYERIDLYVREIAENWELDPAPYMLLAIPRQELLKRAGVSDKTLKRITDYLESRDLLVRFGGRGGDLQGRVVRFAVHPRALIGPLRALTRSEIWRRETGTSSLDSDEALTTPRPS